MITKIFNHIKNTIEIVNTEKKAVLEKGIAPNQYIVFHDVDEEKIKNSIALLSYDIKEYIALYSNKNKLKIELILCEIEEDLLALRISLDIYKNDVNKIKYKEEVKLRYIDFKSSITRLKKLIKKYDEKSRLKQKEVIHSIEQDNSIVKKEHGQTDLQYYSHIGDMTMVKSLIDAYLHIDAQDDNGETALHLAVRSNHIDIVKDLLVHNADLELEDNNGRTPLFTAVKYGYKEIVELLLVNDANAQTYDKTEQTVLELASKNTNKDIIDILQKHGAED